MRFTSGIVKGKGRGGTIVGFPTFNLVIPPEFHAKEGVYACRVWIENKAYLGALHFGPAPTFDDQEKTLEIYVLEYVDEKPLTELSFELGPYLRPVATFLDPVMLRRQIALDVQRVRKTTFASA